MDKRKHDWTLVEPPSGFIVQFWLVPSKTDSELGISSPNSSLREEVCLLVATRFLLHIITFRW